jgi:hypothetical protein
LNGTVQIQEIKWDLECVAPGRHEGKQPSEEGTVHRNGITQEHYLRKPENRFLMADAEALDQRLVALRTAIFQILEQLAAARNHRQQPSP